MAYAHIYYLYYNKADKKHFRIYYDGDTCFEACCIKHTLEQLLEGYVVFPKTTERHSYKNLSKPFKTSGKLPGAIKKQLVN